ncbi:hypothetical protein SNOG_15755 [Parastagonospora nodorum SN15]|uniref:Uncharacterized protein n=1 Tax=Phaeosphaeria nodorum (strain SN15 / ATCC MYA-4574 / FGSC 10173) TaxID=321614 RepID=Q0TXK3_PHANO|nr:hypothetical protein SNOG_15755 [Parastagonospora nodorum SN15]EAT76850.1 hypothetical protein SNOG_15755 [Parastagonospora nodorum SN15]
MHTHKHNSIQSLKPRYGRCYQCPTGATSLLPVVCGSVIIVWSRGLRTHLASAGHPESGKQRACSKYRRRNAFFSPRARFTTAQAPIAWLFYDRKHSSPPHAGAQTTFIDRGSKAQVCLATKTP